MKRPMVRGCSVLTSVLWFSRVITPMRRVLIRPQRDRREVVS